MNEEEEEGKIRFCTEKRVQNDGKRSSSNSSKREEKGRNQGSVRGDSEEIEELVDSEMELKPPHVAERLTCSK